MTIPNTITRTLDLPHPQEKVWAAVSTNEGIASWFGSSVDGEIAPGNDIVMRWQEYENTAKILGVKVVDPMSVFAYTWTVDGAPDDDPRRTYVEFALTAAGSGTRLTVTETGFAQLPQEWLTAYEGNIKGWQSELGKLVTFLDGALVARG